MIHRLFGLLGLLCVARMIRAQQEEIFTDVTWDIDPKESKPPKGVMRAPDRGDAKLAISGRTIGRVGSVRVATGVYAGTNTSSRRYITLEPGVSVPVVSQAGDWLGLLMVDGRTGWVPANRISMLDWNVIQTDVGEGMPQIVQTALRYLGIPYVWGGVSPSGMDCSGFVQRVFREHGIHLPRTATPQMRVGREVPPSEMQPGDRVYFLNRARTRIDHTGIYIGNGKMIHAASRPGRVVVEQLIGGRLWDLFCGARR